MKSLRSLAGVICLALVALVLSPVPAGAQTLTALNLERTIALSNIVTTLTPNIPANLLASIAGGALEVREQLNFNTQQNTLTATYFAVATGSPTPTNLAQVNAGTIIAVTQLTPDKIYIATKPSPSIMLVGTITNSSTTPFGNYALAPAVFAFGYTTDTPPKINNVVELISGAVTLFSPAATGTFTVTGGATSGGGGTPAVTITVSGPGAVTGATNTFQTGVNTLSLDASKSTSTATGALTYSWVPVAGFPSVSITGGTTANPTFTLSQKSLYQFTLTVTDSTGASSKATVTIDFI